MLGKQHFKTGTAAAIMAMALAASACNPDSATTGPSGLNGADFAANLKLVSGDQQSGATNAVLSYPIVVRVVDAAGQPVAGVNVSFSVRAGGGSVTPGSGASAANGTVTAFWTLGPVAGPNQVVALLSNQFLLDSATFNATGGSTGGPAPVLAIRRVRTPLLQSDTTGSTIGAPDNYSAGVRDTLIVQVYDVATGNGVSGVPVVWTTQAAVAIDGFPLNAVTVTDASGFAKTLWVLRSTDGRAIPPSSIAKRMFATLANVGQVEFQAHVYPGQAASVVMVVASNSPVVSSLSNVTATLADISGNPISGGTVGFAVSGGGGSVAPASVTTGIAGTALTTWTFGPLAGPNALTATGSATALPYSLVSTVSSTAGVTTIPVAPAAVVGFPTPPASAAKGTSVSVTVRVKDASGNPIPNVSVTFSVATGGGSVVPFTATTDASGLATTSWTLGPAVGANTLTVSAGTVSVTLTVSGT